MLHSLVTERSDEYVRLYPSTSCNLIYFVLLYVGQGFSGHYDEYFSLNTDTESVVYFMLANDLLHSTYPFITTVAEVSTCISTVTEVSTCVSTVAEVSTCFSTVAEVSTCISTVTTYICLL